MIVFSEIEKYIIDNKDKIISLLVDYAETDVLIFWSKDNDLSFQQSKKWLPILKFIEQEMGISIAVSYDLKIPKIDKIAINKYIKTLYLKELAGLFLFSTKLKSVFLGLALIKNNISVNDAFEASFLEEIYQNSLWGEDKETIKNHQAIKNELNEIKEYWQNG